MSYTLDAATYRRLKSNLTRAVNSKRLDRIESACAEAFETFEREGYPDDWSRWQRARDDAQFAARMGG